MGNKSFILYDSDLKSIKKLPGDMAGEFILALVDYRLTGTVPDFSDNLALDILFSQIKEHVDINEEKYEEIRKLRAKAAKTRWQKEKTKDSAMRTPDEPDENTSETMQMHTKSKCGCYNDNVNDNENENDNDNDNVNDNDNENGNVNVNADDNVCVNNDTHTPENTQTQKTAHGIYRNVFLSDEEYSALTHKFPVNLNEIINSMSTYLKISGKAYADYYTRLLTWKLYNDTSQSSFCLSMPKTKSPAPSYDIEAYMKKAIGIKYERK